jgi:putative transcriptional regulator
MNTESASDLSNHFLIAMPSLEDPNFGGSLVFVAEHNEQGALGLVINRPMEIDLATLFRRIDLSLDASPLGLAPVMVGGPVQTDRGFVLHQPVGNWSSTVVIREEIGLTSSRDVLEAVAAGSGPERMLVMLGYAGWGPGQLEDEIARNAWLTVEADASVIFDTSPDERLHRAFALLGVNPAFLTSAAGHA